MSEAFYVQLIDYETDTVQKQMGPFPERWAEKIDRGQNINLNHDEFYTRILDASEIGDGKGTGK
jgi:hypothetical protein